MILRISFFAFLIGFVPSVFAMACTDFSGKWQATNCNPGTIQEIAQTDCNGFTMDGKYFEFGKAEVWTTTDGPFVRLWTWDQTKTTIQIDIVSAQILNQGYYTSLNKAHATLSLRDSKTLEQDGFSDQTDISNGVRQDSTNSLTCSSKRI